MTTKHIWHAERWEGGELVRIIPFTSFRAALEYAKASYPVELIRETGRSPAWRYLVRLYAVGITTRKPIRRTKAYGVSWDEETGSVKVDRGATAPYYG